MINTNHRIEFDPEKCVGCKKCENVCIYEAISIKDGKCHIDPEKCDGCGLCPSVCRVGAISIHPKGE